MLLRTIAAVLLCASAALAGEAIIRDETHFSRVFGEERHYRVFLPPDYESSAQRYPVIYWFHGWSERYNQPVADTPHRNYDAGPDYGGDTIAAFVATHPVIVVKWDGYNPRTPGEKYPRPYNISPVETSRQFPLYFPELVAWIDAHYRTLADREHRATAGLSMGGFMSFWVAGKYPDLVGSASNFMGSSEFLVGPQGMETEYRHDEMYANYEGLCTRLVTGTRDFIRFYHAQMNAVWQYTRSCHETEQFDSDHGTPGMAKTLAFHMRNFAHPRSRPAVWSHIDVYPSFQAWGWEVRSDRRQAGFTLLEHVSRAGLRTSVREWLPGGRLLSGVKLEITSAKLLDPRQKVAVQYLRVRDGALRRESQAADAEGRLHFQVDGEEYEIGIGAAPALALDGFELRGAQWATAGAPVEGRARFRNTGGRVSQPVLLRWQSPNPNVTFAVPSFRLPALEPGGTYDAPIDFTVHDPQRAVVRILASGGPARLVLTIPLFPPARPAAAFRIADGTSQTVYQHAVEKSVRVLGEGNADGHADPGERIAILLPDGDAWRAAELFSNDACMDLSTRVADVWSDYDHVGASAKVSLPRIAPGCAPGHVVRALARVLMPHKPDHEVRWAVIEFPIQHR